MTIRFPRTHHLTRITVKIPGSRLKVPKFFQCTSCRRPSTRAQRGKHHVTCANWRAADVRLHLQLQRERFPFVQRPHVGKPVLQHMHLGIIHPQSFSLLKRTNRKMRLQFQKKKIRYMYMYISSIKSNIPWYSSEKIYHAWKCLGDSERRTEVKSPHPIFLLKYPDMIIPPQSHISSNFTLPGQDGSSGITIRACADR